MPKKRLAHKLTFEKAQELFSYDPETGDIRLKKKRYKTRKPSGALATSPCTNGYLRLQFEREEYLAHRVAWLLTYGVWPADQLDHIDRNKHNNRISNLRECTTAENHQNQAMTTRKGTSRYIGVCKPSQRDGWRAFIGLNGKQMHLGTFRCETAAYVAYCKAKSNLHNFVLSDRQAVQ